MEYGVGSQLDCLRKEKPDQTDWDKKKRQERAWWALNPGGLD